MRRRGRAGGCSPVRRSLVAGGLIFVFGLGIGVLAGGLSDAMPGVSGVDQDGSASRRAPPSAPATGEQRAEVPLFFVAFGSEEPRDPPVLAAGAPWML